MTNWCSISSNEDDAIVKTDPAGEVLDLQVDLCSNPQLQSGASGNDQTTEIMDVRG